jgi:hypothetical protein
MNLDAIVVLRCRPPAAVDGRSCAIGPVLGILEGPATLEPDPGPSDRDGTGLATT